MVRATVIIPTFGKASFAVWAIKSVQQQTVRDLEICIICDGSPPEMVSVFNQMASQDNRLKVFVYPKSPRNGEPYRDAVIRQTSGRIICYCSHDDLWLPHHVATLEKTLRKNLFTHSMHAYVNLPAVINTSHNLFGGMGWTELGPETIRKMIAGQNYFGLTFGAHTRDCYFKMPEGWVTTPLPEVPTDFYMWRKFLTAFPEGCHTTLRITALNFRKIDRRDWSETERAAELEEYFPKLSSLRFRRDIYRQSLQTCPSSLRTRYFLNNLAIWWPHRPFVAAPLPGRTHGAG